MEYDVYIQDNFYKTISATFVSNILRIVTFDIHNNLVPNFDDSKPASIKIIPVTK
jgi:hypothetical protein